jgi:hypothetical protein
VSRREDIDVGIWADPEIAALEPVGKLAYIWAFTNSHCGMSGLYKIRPGTLAFETGLTSEQEYEAWAELSAADFAHYVAGVVWVRSRVKHLRTIGTNMAKSIAKDVAKIDPQHPLRVRFLETYGDVDWLVDFLAPLRSTAETVYLEGLPGDPAGEPSELGEAA